MNAVPFSAIARIERGRQAGRPKFGQVPYRAQLSDERHDAVNSSPVITGANIECRETFRRNPARMLDDEAVHIHNPQRSVRSGARLHGTKPIVFRRKKLALPFVGRPIAFERDAFRFEREPMHEIVHRFADECVAVVIRSRQIVTIDAQSACRSRAPGRTRVIEPFQHPAAGEQLIRIGIRRHKDPRFRRDKIGVPARVVIGQGIMPEQRAVVAAEPVAEIIAHPSLLRDAGRRLEFARVRMHPKVATIDVNGRGIGVLEFWSAGFGRPLPITPILRHSNAMD